MRDKLKAEFGQLTQALYGNRKATDAENAIGFLKVRVALQAVIDVAGDDEELSKAIDNLISALASMEKATEADLWEHDYFTRMLVENVNKAIDEVPGEPTDHNVHKLTDPAVRNAVLKLTDGKCTYCGTPIGPPGPHNDVGNFVVEHVVPKSKGGPDNIVNFVPACRGCNNAKGDRHVLHFITNVLPSRVAKAGGGL